MDGGATSGGTDPLPIFVNIWNGQFDFGFGWDRVFLRGWFSFGGLVGRRLLRSGFSSVLAWALVSIIRLEIGTF